MMYIGCDMYRVDVKTRYVKNMTCIESDTILKNAIRKKITQ